MKELPKIYEPQKFEDEIYKQWEESGYFNPDKCIADGITSKDAEHFSMVLPPPNVTGHLHTGHASMLAIEDVLTRFHRMLGHRTLWLPGTDHAAIATQTKVEKLIKERDGKSRHDLGRDAFLEEVHAFAKYSHDTIVHQTKKMGSSLDWSREAYTLDDQRNLAVRTAFKKMFDDGLIYRGQRVVNWCPCCASTLADDEVEHKKQNAKLYTFKYDKDFPFEISTTRPETKLGDTAVAVNPKDERYKDLIGKTFSADFCGVNLEIKIIEDRGVDMEFGTGALGVTPAHSMIDWQMAKKNDLPIIKVIDENANIREGFDKYSGKSTFEAREMIVKCLQKENLISKEEEIENNLSVCYRCGGAVEPLPSLQWFIDVNKKINVEKNKVVPAGTKEASLKELMLFAVNQKHTEIIPENFNKIYFHWIENLQDWCISRQIWFGHRIPVWHKSIPTFSELENLKANLRQMEVGEEGSAVATKKAPEYRFVLESKEDFDWVKDNITFKEKYAYTDFFDGKNRTRIAQDNFVITAKETSGQGVIAKQGISGLYKGGKACIEERCTAGYARYEIEFKGELPEYFQSKTQISSTDLLNKQNPSSEKNSAYVSTFEPFFNEGWKQDEDTLDTWFSSGLWTFSTLGWPDEKASDFINYHPTSVLETGYDILFFWVARMILMTTYLVGNVPFKTVYLHGLVRDEQGRKMSKSLGNVIDPLDVIEKYGTDAVRLSLMMGTAPGQDLKLGEEKIESYRNFTNKLWNISRYIISSSEKLNKMENKNFTLADKWILVTLGNLIEDVTEDLNNFRLSQAGEKLKDFTWNEFADWYIEVSKFEDNKLEKAWILNEVLETILKLWHPFMPFVTETIWKELGNKNFLMVEKWPQKSALPVFEYTNGNNFDSIKEIIKEIRNGRLENGIDPKKKISVILDIKNASFVSQINLAEFLESQEVLIKNLRTGVEKLNIISTGEKMENAIQRTVAGINIYIPLEGLIDVEKEKEKAEKEIANLEKFISGLESRLNNKDFVSKAPANIIDQQKQSLAKAQAEANELKKHLSTLQ